MTGKLHTRTTRHYAAVRSLVVSRRVDTLPVNNILSLNVYYRVGQIKHGNLSFLLVTVQRIYKTIKLSDF